jgi:membrane protease YdiL (CAAX protease family)
MYKQKVTVEIENLQTLIKGVVGIFLTCVAYSVIISDHIDLDRLYAPYFSLFLIPALSVLCFVFMLRSPYTFAEYGFNLKGWRKTVKESLLVALVLIGLAMITKVLLLAFDGKYSGFGLFSPSLSFSHADTVVDLKMLVGYICLYSLFTPLQEMMARGFMQTLLHRLFSWLPKNKRNWSAIVVSNLVFAFTHLHLSVEFALMAFFTGLIWGWMYSRHNSLLGVSMCHIVSGLVVIFLIGFKF